MENDETPRAEMEEKRNPLTAVIVTGVGIFSVLVLLFPSLLPDVIPVVGALDEAAATALLISCLAYFGVDLGGLFGRKKKDDSDVIDVEVDDQ
jgi:uncharacterized membrane protein YkvA (DUF1232 family)